MRPRTTRTRAMRIAREWSPLIAVLILWAAAMLVVSAWRDRRDERIRWAHVAELMRHQLAGIDQLRESRRALAARGMPAMPAAVRCTTIDEFVAVAQQLHTTAERDALLAATDPDGMERSLRAEAGGYGIDLDP